MRCQKSWSLRCGGGASNRDQWYMTSNSGQILAVIAAIFLMLGITMLAYLSIVYKADPTILVAAVGT